MTTIRVDNHNDPTESVRAHGNEPLLASRTSVLRGKRERIEEHGLRVGKANPMLLLVGRSLPGIPYNPHE
jgi:hypothetical protein